MKWLERKFDFTFPAEQLPNLIERLEGTPERLEEMLRGVSPAVLQAKPDGKWSAQEHAGHLLDLEALWLTRIDDFVADRQTLTAADLTNRNTNDAHNSRPLAEILAAFRAARRRLLDRVENSPPATLTRTMLHPRLQQPMRLVDHLYFAAEHDDHHLARIRELINS